MDIKKRTMEIYETVDYDKFVMNKFNRPISQSKVKYFIKDFEKDGYCDLFPIMVKKQEDGKLLIFKGHHRYVACRDSNTPICYAIIEELNNEYLTKGEKVQNQMKAKDCINMYAKQGRPHYVKLERLFKENEVDGSIGEKLMFGFGNHGGVQQRLVNGDINITEEMEIRFEIRALNYKRLKACSNLCYGGSSNWGNILFILDNSDLTLKFKKYLSKRVYDITKTKKNLREQKNTTYEEDLMEKLSKIKL